MTHTDPVCGMAVDEATEHRTSHNGMEYYFCSADCKAAFERTPEQYESGNGSPEVH